MQKIYPAITSCSICYLVRLLVVYPSRDICLCPEAHGSSIYHLGIRKSVNQSNLCRANEKRDYRIYEGLGMYLIGILITVRFYRISTDCT